MTAWSAYDKDQELELKATGKRNARERCIGMCVIYSRRGKKDLVNSQRPDFLSIL